LTEKPAIGITTGCPCGIGPEIVSKAINDERVLSICRPVVFGKPLLYKEGRGEVESLPHPTLPLQRGGISPCECGAISMSAVDDAVRAVMTGEVEAIVTAPINKSHWKAAGSPFPGHTEYLASVSGAKNVAMMMVSPRLKIVLVTTHLALTDVPQNITFDKICYAVRLTDSFLKDNLRTHALTHSRTSIVICALNPHAGDGGTFGDEEERIIIPAIKQLQNEGLNVSGPYPADTVFWKATQGEFDAVVAMYHDQALIPIKTLDFKDTVNVTLGLPFVRTSPDHGTAEDIAGKGIADHHNMVRAIEMAVELTRRTKCHK